MRGAWLIAGLALLISGCGPKRIDTRTGERYLQSLEAVRGELKPEEQQQFDAAVRKLAVKYNAEAFGTTDTRPAEVRAVAPNATDTAQRVADTLNGKSAREILAMER